MKKFILNTGLLFSLTLPCVALALGLGDMTVHSYLNQPFDAEIKLLDIEDIPLSQIKASLAAVKDFERIGLERAYILDALTFRVDKTNKGQAIIRISSHERITEPYLEILLDLVWPEGQVYRAYTVLLDPPQYKLETVKKYTPSVKKAPSSRATTQEMQEEVVSHKEYIATPAASTRGVATYGPTLAKETIWQIAQRYKTEEVSLQQVILAIVGANPEAFAEGNVNGLRKDVKLTIPTPDTIKKVPESLAKEELLRHEHAWQENKPINHILLPPYYKGEIASSKEQKILVSEIPSLPKLIETQTRKKGFFPGMLAQTPAILSAQEDAVSGIAKPVQQSKDMNRAKLQAEMHVAQVAIESVSQSNALLNKQIFLLQENNQRLQRELAKKEEEIKRLQQEIRIIKTRQGLAGQTAAIPQGAEEDGFWLWLLLLLLVVAGGSAYYWWFFMRSKTDDQEKEKVKVSEPISKAPEPTIIPEPKDAKKSPKSVSISETTMDSAQKDEPAADLEKKTTEVEEQSISAKEEAKSPEEDDGQQAEEPIEETAQEKLDEYVLEFEPGLDKVIETPKKKEAESTSIDEGQDESLIEYEVLPVEVENEPAIEEKQTDLESKPETEPEIEPEIEPAKAEKPVKSTRALQTLLDLAKTYIDMEDFEAARQSLEEVLQYGTDVQKEKARDLLESLPNK